MAKPGGRVKTSIFALGAGEKPPPVAVLVDAIFQVPFLQQVVAEGNIDPSSTTPLQREALNQLQTAFQSRRDKNCETIDLGPFYNAMVNASNPPPVPGSLDSLYSALKNLLNAGFPELRSQVNFNSLSDGQKELTSMSAGRCIAVSVKVPPGGVLPILPGYQVQACCYSAASAQFNRCVYRGESSFFASGAWYTHSQPMNPSFLGKTFDEVKAVQEGHQVLFYEPETETETERETNKSKAAEAEAERAPVLKRKFGGDKDSAENADKMDQDDDDNGNDDDDDDGPPPLIEKGLFVCLFVCLFVRSFLVM